MLTACMHEKPRALMPSCSELVLTASDHTRIMDCSNFNPDTALVRRDREPRHRQESPSLRVVRLRVCE